MIGSNTEKDFSMENYDKFYEHHLFQPFGEEDALRVNEIIPRFGWAFDEVEELAPKTLLDLGCLDGSFALTVAEQLGVDVAGVDLTVDGVNLANERAQSRGLPAIFFQGKIEDFLERQIATEGTKRYDVVTCFEVLEHVEDPTRLLKLIDKVLAPGGTVLISTPAFESPLYGKDDEKNKCHIRLYTTRDEDYEEANKYGNVRKATSITKEIGKDRIKSIGVFSELINVRYQ